MRNLMKHGIVYLCLLVPASPALARGKKTPAAKAAAPGSPVNPQAKAPDAQPAPVVLKRKKEDAKDAIDDVADKYAKARKPQKEQPPVPVMLSAGDCKSFAKDFIKAGGKVKAREADGLFNAGVVYDQCGMKKEAEDQYKAALSKNPKFGPAMTNLGVLYQNAGQSVQAMNQYEAAIRADPKSAQAAQAYTDKAMLQYLDARRSGGTFAEAISTLKRALAVDSNAIGAYHLLAQIYFQTAETDRSKLKLAQLVCDEGRKINEDYAPIYNTQGLIKLRSQDVTGALTEFRKAASLDPGLIEAQLNIAAISLNARSYKQAEEAFQAVLKRQPNNLDATVGMGVATRGERRIDDAEGWYKKVIQVDPKNCAVFYNLGVLYQDYKSGNPDELRKAQEYYNKYASCPARADADKAADARRRIKDIDDTFKAIEEQKKLEAELKKQQEEMERQQKLQDDQMKKSGATPEAPK